MAGPPLVLRDDPPVSSAPRARSDHRSWLQVDWRAKALFQKLLERVPGGVPLHYLLRRIGAEGAAFERECDVKVDDWRLMAEQLRAGGIPIEGATLLEVGTGWYPTFPICLYLAGASRVLTYDTTELLRPVMVRRLVSRLARHVPVIARATGREPRTIEARRDALSRALGRGASLAVATGHVVDYRAPADARLTELPASCVDVVFSNSVLEHVPAREIPQLFAEAARILWPGGVMFHAVNCGDHYAHVDPSIDELHYLQYSERQWARWNTRFVHQNRLRAVDFTELARAAGFTIERDTSHATPRRLAQLDQIAVDKCFSRYTREQLAITSIDFIARKPAQR